MTNVIRKKRSELKNEIRVKVDGGYLVSGRNEDPNYDGIYVCFESDSGDVIDIVLAEAKSENNKKIIDTYSYEDVSSEQWTSKFSIKTKDIKEAMYDE